MPHERGLPLQDGASLAPVEADDANTESFFNSLTEPQCGHLVPFHRVERTRTSLSRLQLLQ